MGQESGYQNRGSRLEEICKDEQICSEDRRHIVSLINMSLQEIWDLAYKEGYKDGMLAQLVEQ